jgi:hypothetical protein
MPMNVKNLCLKLRKFPGFAKWIFSRKLTKRRRSNDKKEVTEKELISILFNLNKFYILDIK